MSTATVPAAAPAANGERSKAVLPAIRPPRLPYHPGLQERFGVDITSWKALVEAIFPNATTMESVILALSYCKARKLDPFKRNVHIVPIWNKDQRCMVDTIWPGIGELRTTAFRTGEYAGRGATQFGPDVSMKLGSIDMTFPEWASVTVYRVIKGEQREFCGPRVYWLETYAQVKRDDVTPNDMWQGRPRGQIDKCAEAAALRAAFPEEIGTEYIDEEVQHHGILDAAGESKQKAIAASSSLDELTERITHETVSEVAADPKTAMADTAAIFSKFKSDLALLDMLKAVDEMYDKAFGPDSTIEWTPEQNNEAAELVRLRKEAISASRKK